MNQNEYSAPFFALSIHITWLTQNACACAAHADCLEWENDPYHRQQRHFAVRGRQVEFQNRRFELKNLIFVPYFRKVIDIL